MDIVAALVEHIVDSRLVISVTGILMLHDGAFAVVYFFYVWCGWKMV